MGRRTLMLTGYDEPVTLDLPEPEVGTILSIGEGTDAILVRVTGRTPLGDGGAFSYDCEPLGAAGVQAIVSTS